MSDFLIRLERFLQDRAESISISQLTPDASTREYFRIQWKELSAIACVYPEPFVAAEQSYLDVTTLFESSGLPVAKIYDFDEKLGVIIQEDFGDIILRDVLERSSADEKESLIDESTRLIARIQAATPLAFERDSIASRLRFDSEKLLWELDFFKTHYFETYKKIELTESDNAAIESEFRQLADELSARAKVLCHRDFHAANLMIDQQERLRIIDHQDARIGSPAYDLVSLLLDRITLLPTAEWLADKRRFLLDEREKLGMEKLDDDDFAYEFRLQTIQRCLKAVGTFSYQSVNRGKTYFLPFIKPMFQIVLRTIESLERFPDLKRIIGEQI